ncbi:ketoacyl-ACP synthase III [Carnobacteriaceae bacterium zg-ZUI252]|nr:ketoacyl-ACP synthase III [Carnobacteriaceae bacterium zg-ZUI252]
MGSNIIATGTYIPPKKVLNDDLKAYFDTHHDWIYQRTGIVSRYLSENENTSALASKAAQVALKRAGVSPEKVGFIIVATMSPDYISPSVACMVQNTIGATNAFAFDVNGACSGFIYALSTADGLMNSGQYEYGLVIGAEVMSKLLDWTNRNSTVLFGDGAGAVLLQKSDTPLIDVANMGSDGTKHECLTAHHLPLINPIAQREDVLVDKLSMDGREIFNFATRKVPKLIQETLQLANLNAQEIDYYLCHQANARMIDIIAKKVHLPIKRFPMNIDKYGNTSAATLPILLDEWICNEAITLNQAQKVMLIGFGGGLTWGALIITL